MSEYEPVDFEETEPELKPCPFCGKVPKIRYNRDDEQYRVLCGTKWCRGNMAKEDYWPTPEEAAEGWNDRKSDLEEAARKYLTVADGFVKERIRDWPEYDEACLALHDALEKT